MESWLDTVPSFAVWCLMAGKMLVLSTSPELVHAMEL